MLLNNQLQIYKVQVPAPEMGGVNCYAIRGKTGWSIIDTGYNSKQTRLKWQRFMADNQIEGRDIKGIYLTHWHSDHVGAAGWLQQLSGAPVYISAQDKAIFQKYWHSDFEKIVETHMRNAMPQECMRELFEEHKYWRILTEPYPEFTSIEADETVQLGDFQYSSILTPGHSDGHMCFFNERFGVLLSGDHLLPNITPNIGSNAFSDSDPLGNFLQSLLATSHLDCQLVLPAHGELFADSKKRINEMYTFHSERLALMKSHVTDRATVYDVCLQVFGNNLNTSGLYIAMSETFAHLMYLTYKGELKLEEKEGFNIFSSLTRSLLSEQSARSP